MKAMLFNGNSRRTDLQFANGRLGTMMAIYVFVTHLPSLNTGEEYLIFKRVGDMMDHSVFLDFVQEYSNGLRHVTHSLL